MKTSLYLPEQFSHWLHTPVPYEVEEDWGPSFHEMLGFPWPCPELDAFFGSCGDVCTLNSQPKGSR